MQGTKAADIPQSVIDQIARPLLRIVKEFMAQPGQKEKYREWYAEQMAIGNPLHLDKEDWWKQ